MRTHAAPDPAQERSWEAEQQFQVIFGAGAVCRLSTVCEFEKPLLVTTRGCSARGLTETVLQHLPHTAIVFDEVEANPSMTAVCTAADRYAASGCDGVVAVGGGSAIDTGKVLGGVLREGSRPVLDYMAGRAQFHAVHSVPIVAVPTTAGTGAEVTPFATIWDSDGKRKHSISAASIVPTVAILDPELTVSLPPLHTASTGLDAISQALESYWNRSANVVSRAYAAASVRLSIPSIVGAYRYPADLATRTAMLEASMLAGLAISITRTGLAHSISYPLTAHFGVPHGVAASFTLPATIEFNAEFCGTSMEEDVEALGFGSVRTLVDALWEILHTVGAPTILRDHLAEERDVLALTTEMITPGRADNNLREATVSDVEQILRRSCAKLKIWS